MSDTNEFRKLFEKNMPTIPNSVLVHMYRDSILRLGGGTDWYEKVCEKEILRRLERDAG